MVTSEPSRTGGKSVAAGHVAARALHYRAADLVARSDAIALPHQEVGLEPSDTS
jgi:hypothetical protein